MLISVAMRLRQSTTKLCHHSQSFMRDWTIPGTSVISLQQQFVLGEKKKIAAESQKIQCVSWGADKIKDTRPRSFLLAPENTGPLLEYEGRESGHPQSQWLQKSHAGRSSQLIQTSLVDYTTAHRKTFLFFYWLTRLKRAGVLSMLLIIYFIFFTLLPPNYLPQKQQVKHHKCDLATKIHNFANW